MEAGSWFIYSMQLVILLKEDNKPRLFWVKRESLSIQIIFKRYWEKPLRQFKRRSPKKMQPYKRIFAIRPEKGLTVRFNKINQSKWQASIFIFLSANKPVFIAIFIFPPG
jgi:hypothetical protein